MQLRCVFFAFALVASLPAQDKVFTDNAGLTRVVPYPVDSKFLHSPWPDSLETPFWERANRTVTALKGNGCGNTYFENEKSSYPYAMARFIGGDRAGALSCLQARDANAGEWNQHTLGIDYFPCFTLKGQVRKFFWFGRFGKYLRASYLDSMAAAADLWTESDPATTTHPIYGTGNGEYGYTPVHRGYRVDRRRTDNLRAMREAAVYLMAEVAGNEPVRLAYKDSITAYVRKLYTIGMGEWDSENYLGHTLAPYISLFDFADDPDVKMLARAACDWICTAGALKYWRGGYGGPCARDYGGSSVVFGAGVSHVMALYFGDAVIDDPKPHYDDIHSVMSAYRPPPAVVALARKQFARPVEMLNSKPYYQNWEAGKDTSPEYHETLFFGRTFYMGSVVSADSGYLYDIGPYKLLAENSTRGVDFVTPFTGTPDSRFNEKKGSDEIGQYRNLLVWLRGDNRLPFGLMIPASARTETAGGVLFIELEKTWIAVFTIGLGAFAQVPTALASKYPDEIVLQAQPDADPVAGFAMEVGETPDHATYEAFKQAVLARQGLDTSQLGQAVVRLTGTDGSTLSVTYNRANDIPAVVRNGHRVDWSDHYAVYAPVGGNGPVSLGWMQGTLEVRAGGHEFVQTVTNDGEVVNGPVRAAIGAGTGPESRWQCRVAGRTLSLELPGRGDARVTVCRADGSQIAAETVPASGRLALPAIIVPGTYFVALRQNSRSFSARVFLGP